MFEHRRVCRQRKKPIALIVLMALGVLPIERAQAVCGKDCTTRVTVKELAKQLQERDAVIADLQARVQALEQRNAQQTASGTSSAVAATESNVITPVEPVAPAQRPAGQPTGGASEGSRPSVASPTAPASTAPRAQEAAPAESARTARTAPGEFEVDEQAAERALERTLVATGAALLPAGLAEIQPGFTYVRSERELRSFFRADTENVTVYEKLKSDRFIGDLLLRFGLPFDAQLDVALPYEHRRLETLTQVNLTPPVMTSVDDSGFGDLRLGLFKSLLRAKSWWPDVVARVTWDTNTGDKRITGGFHELGGGLTLSKKQDPLVFIGSLSYATTLENDDVRPGDALGFAIGAILAASPETSLRAVLSQTFIGKAKVRGISLSGTDRTSGVMSFGASAILGRGLFLDFTAGVGLTPDAPDYTVGLTFSKRFDFPGRF